MKFLGKIFIAVVIIFALLYAVYYAGTKGWLEKTPLAEFDYQKLNFLSQENLQQTQVLSERAKETTEHVQQILGDKVEVDEQATQERKDKAIHEKTLEYVRYLYCQQVVEDWKDQNLE